MKIVLWSPEGLLSLGVEIDLVTLLDLEDSESFGEEGAVTFVEGGGEAMGFRGGWWTLAGEKGAKSGTE
jgi:hypothetical protein